MSSENEHRRAVIAEAQAWLRTPYHSGASVIGVGCDCLTFPAAVYAAVGAIPPQTIPYYPPDWHLHRDDERYLEGVRKVASEVPAPLPGDFVLWRIGRALAHGAIVIAWPRVIHAVVGIGVTEGHGDAPALRFNRHGLRDHRFYSPWAKP
jgi:NlpC/P60 family putative phage cell wall peptidase